MIELMTSGFHTLLQDAGRRGFQQYGMPVSGVLDFDAYRLANWLVGNSLKEAVLEITLIGPTIRFHENTFIAITGADISPTFDGVEGEMYKTIFVKKGVVLKFGKLKLGCRAYISFSGGILVPEEMNSVSTYTYAKIGGLEGNALCKGVILNLGEQKKCLLREVPKIMQLKGSSLLAVRVLSGIENNLFDEMSLKAFYTTEYKIQVQSNRMGYRMEGEKLQLKKPSEMISSGIVKGTIQIPKNGEPIILLADAQTTGGYPRIANVISADISYLAQQRPGDFIRFRKVTLEQAQSLYYNKEREFNILFKTE